MARLVRLSQPKRVETRQQPCTVYIGNGCKVKYYKREVLIALILVLDVMPLAIIYIVIYMCGKWLKVKYFIN